MLVMLLVLRLATAPASAGGQGSAPEVIDWPDFYAHVTVLGLEYSDRMKVLEGRRVRLRGYSIPTPVVPGALLLTKEPFAASDAEETEIPFDVVGVVWKRGISLPPIPIRPTVEGTLRLGNRSIGDQIVTVTLENAVPLRLPKRGATVPAKGRSGGG